MFCCSLIIVYTILYTCWMLCFFIGSVCTTGLVLKQFGMMCCLLVFILWNKMEMETGSIWCRFGQWCFHCLGCIGNAKRWFKAFGELKRQVQLVSQCCDLEYDPPLPHVALWVRGVLGLLRVAKDYFWLDAFISQFLFIYLFLV